MIDATLKEANILIIDDQIANIDILEGYLELEGYNNIATTNDPRTVVELFAEFNPDIVLLDLSMPFLSGYDVMKQLHSLTSAYTYLPILVLTADVSAEAKKRALSEGANDFLTKPFDLVEVGLRIRNLLFTSYLQQTLEKQNLILEQKVMERTRALEEQNKELAIAKEKAENANNLKTQFLNNISHELRTPLNGIMGFSQLLAEPDLNTEKQIEYINILNESSNRLLATMTNIMDVSILHSGNQQTYKKSYAPKDLLNEPIQHYSELCRTKNIEFKIESPSLPNDFKIDTDFDLLTKVLNHLINNALKFTEQGSITIGYTFVESQNIISFFVKDTGIGISPEWHQKIFEPFYQELSHLNRTFEGNGLGLTIAQGIVDLLGGKIWCESAKNRGATFFISLPISNSNLAFNDPTTSSSLKPKILVAEDDDLNFTYLQIILSQINAEVIRVKNGADALEVFGNNPNIQLVLMDLKMPVMDGFEATKNIRLLNTHVPIWAITAFAGSDDKQKAIHAGCNEFFVKPVKKDSLKQKLSEYGIVKTQE